MNTETKPKKESKLDIDGNYDLRLVKTLNPVLRWVLALPIAFLAAWAVQIVYGFVFKLFLSNFDEYGVVSIVVNSIFMIMKYSVFVVVAVATSPVARNKKFVVSIVFAIIASLLSVGATALAVSLVTPPSWTMIIATSIAAVVGAFLAVWNVHSATSKPVTEESKDLQL